MPLEMKLKNSTALLVLLVSLLSLTSLFAGDFSVITSLEYSNPESKLTLDLYLPDTPATARPCVIVIQGGGFRPQDGQRFKPLAEHLAENGFAAALISYRGRPDHQYKATSTDVFDSVRYIRSVAEKYKIAPDRIGATGRSAGGTLAALLTVNAPAESQIQAAVCFAGVFDFISRFTDPDQLAIQPGHAAKIRSNGEWIGAPFAASAPDWIAASAISHIDSKDPPILFLHSRNDSTVPWQQSRDMHAAMQKAGIASEIKLYKDGGHTVKPKGENALDAMVEFFRKYLGK